MSLIVPLRVLKATRKHEITESRYMEITANVAAWVGRKRPWTLKSEEELAHFYGSGGGVYAQAEEDWRETIKVRTESQGARHGTICHAAKRELAIVLEAHWETRTEAERSYEQL